MKVGLCLWLVVTHRAADQRMTVIAPLLLSGLYKVTDQPDEVRMCVCVCVWGGGGGSQLATVSVQYVVRQSLLILYCPK